MPWGSIEQSLINAFAWMVRHPCTFGMVHSRVRGSHCLSVDPNGQPQMLVESHEGAPYSAGVRLSDPSDRSTSVCDVGHVSREGGFNNQHRCSGAGGSFNPSHDAHLDIQSLCDLTHPGAGIGDVII
jgi:hypothetical protein